MTGTEYDIKEYIRALSSALKMDIPLSNDSADNT